MIIDHPQKRDIPRLQALWQQAFGDTEAFLRDFFRLGFSPERCLCLWEDDIAAMLYWFDCRMAHMPLAYLYAVATDEASRGKGHCHALMEQAHRLLSEQGYAGTVLVPGNESLFRFYATMGYRPFGGMDTHTCRATGPVALRPVTVQEYMALRPRYLPADSVVQAGALAEFLESQARFYAGDDFLVCVAREGEDLFAPELLGDPARAGGILAALGKQQGTFRTPGNAPFAMFRPLADMPTPGYFAFALD